MSKINNWGGFCSADMSWNSNRLKSGKCEPWQHHLYNSWYDHGKWIHGKGDSGHTKAYYNVYFDPSFYSFESFYNYISKDPLFKEFKMHHQDFDIDKDSKSGVWGPGSVCILPYEDNLSVMFSQNPLRNARTIEVVDSNGRIKYFSSAKEADIYYGTSNHISSLCRSGKKVTRGRFKGWTFRYI